MMTNNLRLVILGLIGVTVLLIGGIVAIALVQTVNGDSVDVSPALITLVGTPLGALVGILVPATVANKDGEGEHRA